MDPRVRLSEESYDWKPPSELMRCCPREVILTGRGRGLVGLVLFFLFAAVAVGIAMYAKATAGRDQWRQIVKQGRDTNARVVRRWITQGKQPEFRADFVYTAAGLTYPATTRLERNAWDEAREGSVLMVRYLPAHPQLCLVAGQGPDLIPIWTPFAIAVILLSISGLMARQVAVQRRLLEYGKPALAVITRQKNTKDGKVVFYSFAAFGGRMSSGKSGPTRKSPGVGSLVCVLYEPDRLGRNAIYPLGLVRSAATS